MKNLYFKNKKNHFNRMLNVSLTYLRGLEVAELKEEYTPII